MPGPYTKNWQFGPNIAMNTSLAATTNKNVAWWIKAFLKGDTNPAANAALSPNNGLWTCYSSNDGAGNFGNGDGIDYWGTLGGSTGNTGTVANIVTGASNTGWVRLTGLTGMTASSVGHFMTISGAASAANNSATSTPWRIVNFVSSTSVDIFNPAGVTGDANNGAITWTERTVYTFDSTKIVNNTAGNNHSWFVLKSPAAMGPWYFTIDCVSATTTTYALILSKTAPSGGTATARPTATDESTTGAIAIITSTTTQSMYGGITNEGDFYILNSDVTSNSAIPTVIFVQTPVGAKSVDAYPVVMYVKFAGTGSNGLSATNLTAVGNWFVKNHNGSIALTNLTTVEVGDSATTSLFDLMTAQDYTDNDLGEAPVWLFNNVAGNYTLKGRLLDIRRAPNLAVTGTCSPTPTNVNWIVVGSYWIPGSAAVRM